jgi:surface antigen
MTNTSTVAAVALMFAFTGAWALNTSVFQDAPITRLKSDELKEFFAVIEKTLDATAEGATVEWKAPKTHFVSKITPQKRFNDGELQCREATIESDAQDRFQRGLYTFCKGGKGGWQFRLPSKGTEALSFIWSSLQNSIYETNVAVGE